MTPAFLVLLGLLGLSTTALAQTGAPATASAPAAERHFVLTLLSSFDPIPQNLVPTDIPNLHVYRAQGSVFGRKLYFVRLGFFAGAAEAEAAKARLLARFPAAFVTEILPDEYNEALALERKLAPRPPAPAVVPPPPKVAVTPKPAPAAPRTEVYAVTLATTETGTPRPSAPLPAALRDNPLYVHETVRNGKKLRALNLGFFASMAEAERALQQLRASYPQASIHVASRQEQDDSVRTAVAAPTPAPQTPPAPAPAPAIAGGDTALEKQATALLDRAREALTRGDNGKAIQLLNQVLQLPPNRQSQEAQELVGLAHERRGEIASARREYNLYLKLYPEGDGANRVRQRLASIEFPTARPALKTPERKLPSVTTAYGSLSQYYYHGDTHTDTTTQVGPTLNQQSLTLTDQSALVNSLNFTGRMRGGDWDNRVVVRDTYLANFLENTENENRLYAAYAEVRNKPLDLYGRLGRQPGNTAGVLGRFDGVSMGYSVLPKWRLNVLAGTPADFNPIHSTRSFWATSLDLGTFAERWNGSLYYMNQTVDGIVDRQAVGTEVRYFEPRASLMLFTDYDISYQETNIALLQGTWQIGSSDTVNFLADHRRSPALVTSNAIIGEANTSVKALLQTMTEDQVRAQALDRSPIVGLWMLGAAHNFNPTWQLGGDVKMYDVSGTPASGTLPESMGTGNVYIYTMQGIATGLLTKSDISVLSLSYIDGRAYTGESASLSNRTILRDAWTIDLTLTYYQQHNSDESDLTRLSPMLRLGYRWRNRVTFEGEVGAERTETTSSTQTQTDYRSYYSIGYRWDF